MRADQKFKQIQKWKIIRLHRPTLPDGRQGKELIEDMAPGWGLPSLITTSLNEEPILKWIKSNDISQAFSLDRMGFTWVSDNLLKVTIQDEHRLNYIHGYYHFKAILLD